MVVVVNIGVDFVLVNIFVELILGGSIVKFGSIVMVFF